MANEAIKYEFVTTTREDLFTLSYAFADAIKPEALENLKKPLIVSVNGNKNIELTFINLSLAFNRTTEDNRTYSDIRNSMINLREKPGITFIQNDITTPEKNKTDISFWVERECENVVGPDNKRKSSGSPLERTFDNLSNHLYDNWVRYIQIEIQNPSLFNLDEIVIPKNIISAPVSINHA